VFSRFGVLIWQLEVLDNDTKKLLRRISVSLGTKSVGFHLTRPRLVFVPFSLVFIRCHFVYVSEMEKRGTRQDGFVLGRAWESCVAERNPSPAAKLWARKKKLHFGSRQQKGEKEQTKASGK
jgi:hypothetical protein